MMKFKAQSHNEPMRSQPVPAYPWQFVSQDFFCFESSNFLATLDHFLDFTEVDDLHNTLGSTIAAKTDTLRTLWGSRDSTKG